MARIVGLDPGERRIGVAVSDPTGTIATPHGWLDAEAAELTETIGSLCADVEATVVVIGLPVALDGTEGPAARRSRELGDRIAEALDVSVRYADERFTTVTAEAALIEGGVRRADRKLRRDQVAAAVMLQAYLDREAHRRPAGDGGHPDDPRDDA